MGLSHGMVGSVRCFRGSGDLFWLAHKKARPPKRSLAHIKNLARNGNLANQRLIGRSIKQGLYIGNVVHFEFDHPAFAIRVRVDAVRGGL